MSLELPPTKESTADPLEYEAVEEVIRATVEDVLRTERPVSAGNNGIIYRIDEGRVELQQRNALALHDIHIEGKSAAKLLKIYDPGTGAQEYAMQSAAFDALVRARQDNPDVHYARIPHPGGIRDFALSPEVIAQVNKNGAHLSSGHAECIFMEFIPGRDFARIMYEEVVRRTARAELERKFGIHEDESIDDFIADQHSIDDLMWVVQRILDLKNPSTRAQDGTLSVDRAILLENSRKIFDRVAAGGYKIHPSLAVQLRNTLNAIHAAGISHNDVHERNIMIQGDPTSADAQLYLIDFGAADNKVSRHDISRADDGMVELLKNASRTKEERHAVEVETELRDLMEDILRVIQSPGAVAARDAMRKRVSAGADVAARMLTAVSGRQMLEGIAGLKLLVDEGSLTEQEARDVVTQAIALEDAADAELNRRRKKKVMVRPAERALLRRVVRLLEYV